MFLILLALICIVPFLDIIATSFASIQEVVAKKFILFPTTFSLDAYRYVLSTPTVSRALAVSIGVTGVGTIVSMCITSLMAYGLSRKYLSDRGFVNFLVVFPTLFSGGVISTFSVVRSLGLVNSYWAMILPVAANAMNMVIMRNFFQALPNSLEESVEMDGCTDFGVFFKIMLPLALPFIVTILLLYTVTYRNTYMTAILYINDSSKWSIQTLLHQIVVVSSGMQVGSSAADVIPPAQTVKMAVIAIATVPMLIIYPLVQKYSAKGALVGSVKGRLCTERKMVVVSKVVSFKR